MWKWLRGNCLFLVVPSIFFGQMETMLSSAAAIAQKYQLEVAKTAPPSLTPQPNACLNAASIWFSIDLGKLETPAFKTLSSESFWDLLREIGVQGVYLKDLKQGGQYRTGLGLDPKWGEWNPLALNLQRKGIALIGDSLGPATGLSSDFFLALKNVEGYTGLYHLVEIEEKDWKLLPEVVGSFYANVSWLNLQQLHKKGYVSEKFLPYVKESSWNATAPIRCQDDKMRRYIYLKEAKEDPLINWLNPSFAGYRIAAADTLDSIYNLGEKFAYIDDMASQETLALWTRKLGGFSILKTNGGISSWKKSETDLIVDNLTPTALLHALIAEDAEVLKLFYRLMLDGKIDTKRLVHTLQPFDRYSCDYAEFLADPKRKFQYYEEILTGEALRNRLLKEDAARIQGPNPVSWPSLCMATSPEDRNAMMKAHLLLALFYAMQPGAFSFSLSDLLGLTSIETLNLLEPNENSLYGSLSTQMKNSRSFAMKLRQILSVRTDSGIESAELIAVPETKQKGLLVLLHKLRGNNMTQMLAINFGKTGATQIFDLPSIRQTSAIDLMTGLAETKPLDSPIFQLELPPLSGKVIRFQTKYYD